MVNLKVNDLGFEDAQAYFKAYDGLLDYVQNEDNKDLNFLNEISLILLDVYLAASHDVRDGRNTQRCNTYEESSIWRILIYIENWKFF